MFGLGTGVRELLRSYRWRAKRLLGLSSVEDAFPETVTVIQRFDSAQRLNVHAHTLALDGVYVKSAGADEKNLTFLRLPTPTEEEVHEVAERTAKRVAGLLKKRGRTTEGAFSNEDSGDIDPALAACYDVAGRAPKTRVVDPGRMRSDERVAVVAEGFWRARPAFTAVAGGVAGGRDPWWGFYRCAVHIVGLWPNV